MTAGSPYARGRRRARSLLAGLLAVAGVGCGQSGPPPSPSSAPTGPVIAYGSHEEQVGELYLPAGDGPFPVVVVIHGGFWARGYDRTLMNALSEDLAARGYAAWNIEYRRGAGADVLVADVAAAVDELATIAEHRPLDLATVITLGHSAGGHLALWVAGRDDARVAVTGVVALAPVADLRRAVAAGLGGGAVDAFVGGSRSERDARYRFLSPAERLPLGVPQVLVHGERDAHVPLDQSTGYAELARAAGDDARVVALPGVDHFAVIDPTTTAWTAVVDAVDSVRQPG